MKVLITNAEYKHTLGMTRSLGKKGIYLVVASHTPYSMSFYSRYCTEKLLYPNPRNEDEFVQFMFQYLNNNKIDAVLPVGDRITGLLSKYKNQLCKYTKIPVADYEFMQIASNKANTTQFAKNLGIKIPETYGNPEEIRNFPVVVKGKEGVGNIRYVNSSEELSRVQISGSLLQEYIPGEGYGFFALFNKGVLRASFMHRRIREYPITGGPSTAAESIYDPKLKDLGTKLLEALNWHGVAMVEFKKDSRDGEFKLMEINPKFWGSLDLSIASGVDFPYLLVKMATEGDVEPYNNYKTGIKFLWPFPDEMLHLLASPKSARYFIRDFFNKNTKTNIWFGDIKPNLYQIKMTLRIVASHIRKGNLRYPHGIPEKRA